MDVELTIQIEPNAEPVDLACLAYGSGRGVRLLACKEIQRQSVRTDQLGRCTTLNLLQERTPFGFSTLPNDRQPS